MPCQSIETFCCAICLLQMIFNPSVDNSLKLVCLILAMIQKKIGREKEAKLFNGMNPFTFSKLNSKEFLRELLVQKFSKMMQAWLTLKGTVKKIRCCPVNQLKFFAVQMVLSR